MKRFLNVKIPLWIFGIVILGILFLFISGFRITYAPGLENSWSAISAIAAWAGVFASFVAIVVAMCIPKRIADYQNKIALFEKRFEFYEVLQCCISFSQMIRNLQTADKIPLFFAATFGSAVVKNDSASALYDLNVSLERRAISILQKGKFLFDFDLDENIKSLVSSLLCITSERIDEEHYWKYYSDYMEAVHSIEENLLPKVEKAISLMQ